MYTDQVVEGVQCTGHDVEGLDGDDAPQELGLDLKTNKQSKYIHIGQKL
jgi:hypothetical protein